MEKVYYSNKQGIGIITEGDEDEQSFITPAPVGINGTTINPGERTDLFARYTSPVRYAGMLKDDNNCMVFCLGEDSDLMGKKLFYSCYFRIAEDRIVTKYSPRTTREFIFKNGKWK